MRFLRLWSCVYQIPGPLSSPSAPLSTSPFEVVWASCVVESQPGVPSQRRCGRHSCGVFPIRVLCPVSPLPPSVFCGHHWCICCERCRSRCSTMTTPAELSRRTFRSRFRLPFSSEPVSLTTWGADGSRFALLIHRADQPVYPGPPSGLADDSRAYSTQPSAGAYGTTTKCLLVGSVSTTRSDGN